MKRGYTTISFCVLSFLAMICLAAPPASAEAASPSVQPSAAAVPAAVVRLEGPIDDYNRDAFFKRFNQAKAGGAKVIIVDLDTYGGLVTAGLDISRFIKSQSGVHTIAFVGDKAISAGAMIALACDEIVMSPSAQLGDCAPISIADDGRLESMGATERQKQESPILADFHNSAVRNHHNPLLVSSMVSLKVVVRWAQSPDGKQRRFVDDAGFAALSKEGWTEVKDAEFTTPLDSDQTLLTVSGSMAAKLGLASAAPGNIDALAQARHYTIMAVYAPSGGDKVIEWLNNQYVRMFLIVLLIMSIYAALHAPGHGLAEAFAMLSLVVLIGVPLLTGYAQWWEIIVILIGMALLALEIFVIPGTGVAGILGIIMIVFGLIMTFVGAEPSGPGMLPALEGTWTNIRHGLAMVCAALVSSLILSVWLRRILPRVPYFNRLILTATTGNIARPATGAGVPAASSFFPIVGALGEALTELKPGGSAGFYDSAIADVRVFSVISGAGYVEKGTKVVVLDNRDNRIIVRPENNV